MRLRPPAPARLLPRWCRRSSLSPELRRLNLSFVLHEPSSSATVSAAACAVERHAKTLGCVSDCLPIVLDDRRRSTEVPLLWLSAHIGQPACLGRALAARGLPTEVVYVDGEGGASSARFFRAPSTLCLPDVDGPVGVAALLLRPGSRDAQLVLCGPWRWPDEREPAIHAVEALVQAFCDQWLPPRPLWAAPAEDLLPEVTRPFSRH